MSVARPRTPKWFQIEPKSNKNLRSDQNWSKKSYIIVTKLPAYILFTNANSKKIED